VHCVRLWGDAVSELVPSNCPHNMKAPVVLMPRCCAA